MKEENNSQGSNSSLIAGQPAPTPRTPLRVVPKPRVNPLRVVPPTTVPEVVFARASNGIIFRRVVGQGVTRFIPLVGWGLLANDLVELAEQGIESLQPNGGTVGGSNFELAPVPPPSTPPSETITYWQGTVFPDPFSWFPGYVYGELNNGRGRTDGDVREYNPSTNYDPPTTDISEPPVTPDTFPGQLADPVELPFSEAPQQPLPPDPTPRPGNIPMTMGGSFIPVLPKPTEPETNPTTPPVLPHPLDITFDPINTDRPGPRISGENSPNVFRDPSSLKPRASQEPENATNNQSEPTGEASEDSTPADPAIAEQEDKKAAVEEEVSELSDADRAINNLPDGLEKKLNAVGYIINRGDKPSIAYRGTTEHGTLPSGSQLHLQDGENGTKTIEQGSSPTNVRISNSARMKRNILKSAGLEKWPENVKIQAHHLIPDKVFQDSDLALEYAKRNGGKKVVDDTNNLLVAAENAEASRSSNAGVRKLQQEDLMLKNITHFGSHPGYSDRVAEKLRDESKRLKSKYGTLENVPKAEIDAAYLRVQNQMRDELQNADKEIGKGNFNKLLPEVQKYLTPAGGRKRKLSEVPTNQQNNSIAASSESPQILNRKTMSDLSKAIRSLTATVEAANTHSYDLNKIPTSKTPEALAQTLAVAMSKIMQGKNKNGEEITLAQSKEFRAERDQSSRVIKVTHPQTGSRLATIYLDDKKITMQGLLSTQQVDILAGIQNSTQSSNHKSTQRELG
jgi:A nuclease family of the HNH/ENDO VII superfamily with conserved AHH